MAKSQDGDSGESSHKPSLMDDVKGAVKRTGEGYLKSKTSGAGRVSQGKPAPSAKSSGGPGIPASPSPSRPRSQRGGAGGTGIGQSAGQGGTGIGKHPGILGSSGDHAPDRRPQGKGGKGRLDSLLDTGRTHGLPQQGDADRDKGKKSQERSPNDGLFGHSPGGPRQGKGPSKPAGLDKLLNGGGGQDASRKGGQHKGRLERTRDDIQGKTGIDALDAIPNPLYRLGAELALVGERRATEARKRIQRKALGGAGLTVFIVIVMMTGSITGGGTGGAGSAAAAASSAGGCTPPAPGGGAPVAGGPPGRQANDGKALMPPEPGPEIVAGGKRLTPEQTGNIKQFIKMGKEKRVPEQGWVIAVMTAQVESGIRNLTYGDRDSQGAFQQRPSAGWGPIEKITDPYQSAGSFYDHLLQSKGWESKPLGDAAQDVQGSAFPGRYAKEEALGRDAVAQLGGTGGGGGGNAPGQTPAGCSPIPAGGAAAPASASAKRAMDYANQQMGKPYVWGATGPNAFDCSGLTSKAYEAAGVRIPRTASAQFQGIQNKLPVDQAQPGDLVFWGEGRSPSGIHHVAIYLGNNQIAEAQQDGVPVHVRTIRWDEKELVGQAARPY